MNMNYDPQIDCIWLYSKTFAYEDNLDTSWMLSRFRSNVFHFIVSFIQKLVRHMIMLFYPWDRLITTVNGRSNLFPLFCAKFQRQSWILLKTDLCLGKGQSQVPIVFLYPNVWKSETHLDLPSCMGSGLSGVLNSFRSLNVILV